MFEKIQWLNSRLGDVFKDSNLARNANGGLDKVRVGSYEIFTLPAFKTFCNLSLSVPETPFKITGDRQRSRYVLDNTLQGPPAQGLCAVNVCAALCSKWNPQCHQALKRGTAAFTSPSLHLYPSLSPKSDSISPSARILPVRYLHATIFTWLFSFNLYFSSSALTRVRAPACARNWRGWNPDRRVWADRDDSQNAQVWVDKPVKERAACVWCSEKSPGERSHPRHTRVGQQASVSSAGRLRPSPQRAEPRCHRSGAWESSPCFLLRPPHSSSDGLGRAGSPTIEGASRLF